MKSTNQARSDEQLEPMQDESKGNIFGQLLGKTRLGNLEKNLSGFHGEMTALRHEISDLNPNVSSINMKIERLDQPISNVEKPLNTLHSQLEQVNETLVILNAGLKKATIALVITCISVTLAILFSTFYKH